MNTSFDLTQAQIYLNLLFGNKAPEEYVLLWTLEDHKSAWFKDVNELLKAMETPAYSTKDIYAGVCTSHEDMGIYNRCEQAKVASLGGLWIDLDINVGGHKKKNYPPTVEDAMAALVGVPKPSMIVQTGHGVHMYWLFRERYLVRTLEDSQNAHDFSERWQAWIRYCLQQKGWTVDGTFDLARVLRIPGTFNFKDPAHPIAVSLIDSNGTLYDWEDLQAKIPKNIQTLNQSMIVTPSNEVSIGSLILASDRDVGAGVIDLLTRRFGNKFLKSFRRDKVLSSGDDSASAYDESLASYAVMADLDDQTIADLIITSRRNAQQDLKLRQGYYQLTIGKMRKLHENDAKRSEALESLSQQIETTPATNLDILPSEEVQKKNLEALSSVLGFRIDHIFRSDIDPEPEYWMQINGSRRVKIGSIDSIIKLDKFTAKIMTLIGEIVPEFKKDDWLKIVKMMFHCAEPTTGEEEGQFNNQVRRLLASYLFVSNIYDDKNEALTETKLAPFRDEHGQVYIVLDSFSRWIRENRSDNFEQKGQQLAPLLSNIGCKSSVVSYNSTITGKNMQRRVWSVPNDNVPDGIGTISPLVPSPAPDVELDKRTPKGKPAKKSEQPAMKNVYKPSEELDEEPEEPDATPDFVPKDELPNEKEELDDDVIEDQDLPFN
jgi:hypothetical protein